MKYVNRFCPYVRIITGTMKKYIDTPEKLYAKYIGIIAGLSNDSSLWSITLCFYFFSALTTTLKDKMEEKYCIMTPLNNMTAKILQIQGLRIVRTAAVTSF